MNASLVRLTPEGATVVPLTPSKQCQVGRPIREYFFPIFPESTGICPAAVLQVYLQKTKQVRGEKDNHLFLTSTKPHRPASSATIARWIKTALTKAGIDTTIFRAHMARGASTSAVAEAGVSIPKILDADDWSNKSTFEWYYYRP
uniref:Tyr recombinase domain-containing protein n=1 Tax=Amphimedon queenslandica TaxID=400682 RepID=A0A1X7UT20_AMPQE